MSYTFKILAAFSLIIGSAFGDNLLQNGSFETAGNTANTAVYWEWGNPNMHGSFWGSASRETWRYYSGTAEGTIRGTWASAGNSGGFWQETSVTPLATYTFSAWLWADSNWSCEKQGIKIEFYSGETVGQVLLHAVTNEYTDIGPSWVKKTVSGEAPANADWVRAVIFSDNVGASGALQFDDLQLSMNPGTVIILSCIPCLLPVLLILLLRFHKTN